MLRCVHAVRAAGGAEAGVLPGVAECRLGTLWLVGWTHPSPSSTCFFFFCPVHAVPAVPVVVVWTQRGCAAAAAAVGRCRGGGPARARTNLRAPARRRGAARLAARPPRRSRGGHRGRGRKRRPRRDARLGRAHPRTARGKRRRPAVVAAVAGTALDPPTWCWAPRRPHTLYCTVQALVCT